MQWGMKFVLEILHADEDTGIPLVVKLSLELSNLSKNKGPFKEKHVIFFICGLHKVVLFLLNPNY